MHRKRTKIPKTWPIPRKGKKFIAVVSHSLEKGISLLVILRDILKIAKTRKEAKYITHNKMVEINSQIRTNENFPVQVFDTIKLKKGGMSYRLEIKNKKFCLKEISEEESKRKIVKISGKTLMKGGLIQMNLDDGHNFITKEKFSVGDSVILNTKEKKIEKIFPLKEGANVEIVSGRHAGKKGSIIKIENLAREKNYLIKLEDRKVRLPYKSILVIG